MIVASDSIFEIRRKAKRGELTKWDVLVELYVRGWQPDLALLLAKAWTVKATRSAEAS